MYPPRRDGDPQPTQTGTPSTENSSPNATVSPQQHKLNQRIEKQRQQQFKQQEEKQRLFDQGICPKRLSKAETILRNRTDRVGVLVQGLDSNPDIQAVVRTCECMGIQDIFSLTSSNIKTSSMVHNITKGSHAFVTVTNTNTERVISRHCGDAGELWYVSSSSTPAVKRFSSNEQLYGILLQEKLYNPTNPRDLVFIKHCCYVGSDVKTRVSCKHKEGGNMENVDGVYPEEDNSYYSQGYHYHKVPALSLLETLSISTRSEPVVQLVDTNMNDNDPSDVKATEDTSICDDTVETTTTTTTTTQTKQPTPFDKFSFRTFNSNYDSDFYQRISILRIPIPLHASIYGHNTQIGSKHKSESNKITREDGIVDYFWDQAQEQRSLDALDEYKDYAIKATLDESPKGTFVLPKVIKCPKATKHTNNTNKSNTQTTITGTTKTIKTTRPTELNTESTDTDVGVTPPARRLRNKADEATYKRQRLLKQQCNSSRPLHNITSSMIKRVKKFNGITPLPKIPGLWVPSKTVENFDRWLGNKKNQILESLRTTPITTLRSPSFKLPAYLKGPLLPIPPKVILGLNASYDNESMAILAHRHVYIPSTSQPLHVTPSIQATVYIDCLLTLCPEAVGNMTTERKAVLRIEWFKKLAKSKKNLELFLKWAEKWQDIPLLTTLRMDAILKGRNGTRKLGIYMDRDRLQQEQKRQQQHTLQIQ